MILYRSKANIIGGFVVSVIGGILIYLLHDKAGAKFYLAGIGAVAGMVWGWVMSVEMGSLLRAHRFLNLVAGILGGINAGISLMYPVSSGWMDPALYFPGSALIATNFLTIGLLGLQAKKPDKPCG